MDHSSSYLKSTALQIYITMEYIDITLLDTWNMGGIIFLQLLMIIIRGKDI